MFVGNVRNAITLYRIDHPEDFVGDNIPVWAARDRYYFGLVALLQGMGLDALVDDCGCKGICGEIAVARAGDRSFSEQYHVLTSTGDVEDALNAFVGRMTPRWFP